MFANDHAFVVHNHQNTQKIITRFSKSAEAFVLKINLKKQRLCTYHLWDVMALAMTYR